MIVDRTDGCRERILTAQIVAEYLEMPGLSVTMAQACRLWGLDRAECASALHTLLSVKFLRKNGDSFVRTESGHALA
jgi:hypothetical protein